MKKENNKHFGEIIYLTDDDKSLSFKKETSNSVNYYHFNISLKEIEEASIIIYTDNLGNRFLLKSRYF